VLARDAFDLVGHFCPRAGADPGRRCLGHTSASHIAASGALN
jgi:hypothetical protein